MTIAQLQDFVYGELARLFSNYTLRSAAGKTTAIKVYKQDLPVPESDDDAEETPPFIIVRLVDGEQSEWNGEYTVNAAAIICVWDNARERQGAADVLGIITRIHEHFMKHPALCGQFKTPFKWVLNDEDTFPYYYGACQFSLTASAIRREDPLT